MGRPLKGMSRLPRADPRARRNAAQLAGDFTKIFGNGFEMDSNGLLTINVQDPILVNASGVGLNYSSGLVLSGSALIVDIVAGGGLKFTGNKLEPDEPNIDHDLLLNFVANEHIDWTGTTAALVTTGKITCGEAEINGSLNHDGTTVGFYGTVPVVQAVALTAQLTTITHTAPGTPDYAIANLTNIAPYGFVSQDEGNTVLSVIANLQVRVAELEARLGSVTGVGLFV